MRYFLFLFLSCVSLLAKAEYQLSGHIDNAPSAEILIVVYTEQAKLDGQLYKAKIDKKGNYSIQLPITNYSYIKINDTKNELFGFLAKPGGSLWLSYDANKFKAGYKVSKTGAFSFDLYQKMLNNPKLDSLFDLQQDGGKEIVIAVDSFSNHLRQYLSAKKEKLATAEYEIIGADIDGYMRTWKLALSKESLSNTFNSSDNFSIAELYKDYCLQVINNITGNVSKVEQQKLDLIKTMFAGKMREALSALVILESQAQAVSAKSFYNSMGNYKNEYGTNKYTALMDSAYHILTQLETNKPAINFELTDINGKKVSLSDYKDKVIHLRFWASWCPVTKEQYKWLAVVKEYYKNSDKVVFVNVNFDQSVDVWKQQSKEFSIGKYSNDINLSTGGEGSYNKTVKDYSVRFSVKDFIISKDFNFYSLWPVLVVPFPGTENSTPVPGKLYGAELLNRGNGPQDLISQLIEAVNKGK